MKQVCGLLQSDRFPTGFGGGHIQALPQRRTGWNGINLQRSKKEFVITEWLNTVEITLSLAE